MIIVVKFQLDLLKVGMLTNILILKFSNFFLYKENFYKNLFHIFRVPFFNFSLFILPVSSSLAFLSSTKINEI